MKKIQVILILLLILLIFAIIFAGFYDLRTDSVEASASPTFINQNIFTDDRGYIDRFVDCQQGITCYRTQDDISCVDDKYTLDLCRGQ